MKGTDMKNRKNKEKKGKIENKEKRKEEGKKRNKILERLSNERNRNEK